MNPREQRELERQQREEAKKLRLLDAQERQRKLDEEVYGKGSMLIEAQKSSAGGDARGGIWDVSTSNYKQEDNNQQNQNNDIDQRGIDLLGAGTYSVDSGEEAIQFNGSVLLCINGEPYWIDIPYDDSTGPYDGEDTANFPITAPA